MNREQVIQKAKEKLEYLKMLAETNKDCIVKKVEINRSDGAVKRFMEKFGR